ncbi:hypothetical protein SAMN05216466_11817 [Paraburkholderia phenazinium]|uniref:Uncharacterized protein n=2 Tax=Paraburkholderia phenazinium TaxID=60549 RepID=A0A1G8IAM4_9BURK|nr:hypothetical protein SAMN05216466_11817 [Paraburkholderia phenazinium]
MKDATGSLTSAQELRTGGVLVIAAITPAAAIEMPFSAYGFSVYDEATLEGTCVAAAFRSVQITHYMEPLTRATEEGAMREFMLLRVSVRERSRLLRWAPIA